MLEKYGFADEEHGVLTIEQIKKTCFEVFQNYSVDYCYLLGSYAKREVNNSKDVDLLISTLCTGL